MSCPRPVLFLDIDGVINVLGGSPAIALSHLHDVLRATRCDVVLSSSWRIEGRIAAENAMRSRLGYDGPPLLDVTPDLRGQPRGLEIAAWLASYPLPIGPWAVVDDDGHDMDYVRHRFVQTNPRVGLDEVAAARLVDLLTHECAGLLE